MDSIVVQFQEALQNQSLLIAIALSYLGGVLGSFTPCIYPMLPITISIFGSIADRSKSKLILLSFLYIIGMSVTYGILGLMAAFTGMLFGQVASNFWVLLFVGIVIVCMSMSMLGVFEISIPLMLSRGFSTSGKKDCGSVFFMGLVSGLVASPCTTPILIAILSYIAVTKSAWIGTILVFTFSFGLGTILIVIALATSWMIKIPKPGAWMDVVKKGFGLLMCGVGIYFIYQSIQYY